MDYTIKHYSESENKSKEEVLDLMQEYNENFSDFDMGSIEEMAHEWYIDDEEEVSEREALEIFYDELCDELVVAYDKKDLVGLRFVEYDEDDEYFKDRHNDYKQGLNLTFALVDKDYRQEGIWSEMFSHVEKEILPDYNVDRLYLATTSKNRSMQKTAESHGFKEVSRVENERGEGIDTVIYCKKY